MPTKDMKVDWLEDLFRESYSITIQDLLERLSKHKNNGYSQFSLLKQHGLKALCLEELDEKDIEKFLENGKANVK